MPEFISKLQYKTSEYGEYYDEKARTLEETIELINNFPWAREQYAHLGVTGPSITISDPNGNYLKAGIYYGGKYSLYYLDAHGNYYERRNLRMDIIYDSVKAFFAGNVNLQKFAKPKWFPGRHLTKRDFLTKTFEYRIKTSSVAVLCFNWFIFLVSLVALAWFSNAIRPWNPLALIFLIPAAVVFRVIFYIFGQYRNKKDQYLQISRGVDIFKFGDSEASAITYDKNSISKIVKYVYQRGRSRSLFEVFEIFFKDGSTITFSNALISDGELAYKFSDKWKMKIEEERVGIEWLLGAL